jgi:uncharacterized protein YaaW (UPF0174 family)
MNTSSNDLEEILILATEEERKVLTQIVAPDCRGVMAADRLRRTICEIGGHSVMNWVRSGGVGYLEILSDVVGLLKVPGLPKYLALDSEGYSLMRMDSPQLIRTYKLDPLRCMKEISGYTEKAEKAVLAKIMADAYAGMSPADKAKFDAAVQDVAARFGHSSSVKGLTGAAGAMMLAQMGGFATYTLMSTVLSMLSLGTLKFAGYMAASSLLGVAIGPVGWVALGGVAAYKLGKPKDSEILMTVFHITLIRQRVLYEQLQYELEVIREAELEALEVKRLQVAKRAAKRIADLEEINSKPYVPYKFR